MMLLKLVLLIGVLTTFTYADCPITENPRGIIDCLRYLTNGIYGVAIQDLKILCRIASDIANCAKDELGDCMAKEIGKAALEEIRSLAVNCCPERNNSRCSIRDSAIKEQRCFAADSLVTMANGTPKTIVDLKSGDSILAYDDVTKQVITTPVLTMLDYQPHHFAMFKQINTISGRQLSLTSSHLLPTQTHGYVMAKDIHIGMNIYILDDSRVLISDTVSNVSDVVKQGYIAPLTEEGTMIVNNIAASCYATINNHHVAHAVVAPMRWWYRWFGMELSSNEMVGVHWFPKMVYEMTAYLLPSIIHK